MVYFKPHDHSSGLTYANICQCQEPNLSKSGEGEGWGASGDSGREVGRSMGVEVICPLKMGGIKISQSGQGWGKVGRA